MEFPLRLLVVLVRFPRFASPDAVLVSLVSVVLVLVDVDVDVFSFVTGFRCHRVNGGLTASPIWWGGCLGDWSSCICSSEEARARREVRLGVFVISRRISEMRLLLPLGVSLTFLWSGEGLVVVVSSGANDERGLRMEVVVLVVVADAVAVVWLGRDESSLGDVWGTTDLGNSCSSSSSPLPAVVVVVVVVVVGVTSLLTMRLLSPEVVGRSQSIVSRLLVEAALKAAAPLRRLELRLEATDRLDLEEEEVLDKDRLSLDFVSIILLLLVYSDCCTPATMLRLGLLSGVVQLLLVLVLLQRSTIKVEG
jgi:hypothetical protein